MEKPDLVLGIDASTQSMTAVALSTEDYSNAGSARIRYRDDPRLERFGLGGPSPILSPREPGEADQPACVFLAALDLLFADLGPGILSRVAAVNFSAQQHGQILVSAEGVRAIRALGESGAGTMAGTRTGGSSGRDLCGLVGPGLASDRAPIWMSSQTAVEAEEIRAALGGVEAVTAVSGSDSPLRFSGTVLRHIAKRYPDTYRLTARAHLISSFLAGVMAADPDAPIDWGNGSGMSLMNWKKRVWDAALVDAVSEGLEGGRAGLLAKLPPLAHPLAIVGRAAAYFRERYGFPEGCAIVAGSGDNPQSKVLAEGALISLGTSFVLMTEGHSPQPAANAMYDGLGRPFMFGCRTNGSLAWEALRVAGGFAADDFAAAERALACEPAGGGPGSKIRIFQPETESFPASGAIDIGASGDFNADYAGAVDSSLGLMVLASRAFAGDVSSIAVTGGAAASRGLVGRIANFWGVPATPIGEAGAAAGAAVAAACALVPESLREEVARSARTAAARPGITAYPEEAAVRALRSPGAYLARLREAFEKASGLRL